MKTHNVLHAIAALNLEPIKNKLMDTDSGEGWSQAKADAMDVEYRRFLHLMHAFPNEAASPTKAVDTFWHYHILDTQKYAADCDDVFGCFMHHNPYGDERSAATGVSGGDRMQELYEATFGEPYIRAEVYYLDLPLADTACGLGAGIEIGKGKSGAKAAVCHGFCMMQAKPASAKAAVCHGFCMMQAKPASEKAAGVKAAGVKAESMKGASVKAASVKPAGAKAAVCHGFCMMQAKPASALATDGAMLRARQKTPAGAAAHCP